MKTTTPVALPPLPEVPDAWQATRAQTGLATQFLGEEEYLAPPRPDIGRQTAAGVREMFVSCAPAQALEQQFEHLRPEYIAVHDIGGSSARKLLAGLAAAAHRELQKLVIRRQGYGTVLATVEFVELPTAEGTALRLYATDADADNVTRQGLARVLMAHSRLGVVMVGDLPSHAIARALAPWRTHIVEGPWHNSQLLLLPLAGNSTLPAHGAELGLGTTVTVRTTPQVVRPADAWTYIGGTWSRLQEEAHEPPPRPAGMRPMPSVAQERAPGSPIERYVLQVSQLPGVVSCCVFDVASGLEVAHAGSSPGAADLAMHGKALLGLMSASSRGMGLGHVLPEAAITLGSHHLLLRAVPGHAGLAMHAALDKASANLTLVRLQVQRLDAAMAG